MDAQDHFSWYEEVRPPDNPAKTVHVRNHWRRPPGSAATAVKKPDPDVQVQIRRNSLVTGAS